MNFKTYQWSKLEPSPYFEIKGIFIMLTPNQFRVNEAWIAVRINEEFLFVKDEPYDIYVLMERVLQRLLLSIVKTSSYAIMEKWGFSGLTN